jgi:hypothetical protein
MERRFRSLIYGVIPEFAWKDWEKAQKISVRISCILADIWTRDLQNTKHEILLYSTQWLRAAAHP